MKKSKLLFCLLLLLFCNSIIYSQTITTGIYSGINFSNIHGQDPGGKWGSKPGLSEGAYIGIPLTRALGIQTGISFSTVNYKYDAGSYPLVSRDPLTDMYTDITGPEYYSLKHTLEFSFSQIPLLLTVSIPSVIDIKVRAGMLFCVNEYHSPDFASLTGTDSFKKTNFGYLFSSGFTYPLDDRMDLALNFNYVTGTTKINANSNLRHGYSEVLFGLEYKFKVNQKNNPVSEYKTDSASGKITITYKGGLNYSWNAFNSGTGKYLPCPGPTIGFDVNFPIGYGFYIVSGISFDRKGYSLRDSSTSSYRYNIYYNHMSFVKTKVQIDYATIPFLVSFPVGKSQKIFFNTGPWLGLRLNAHNIGAAYKNTPSDVDHPVQKTIVHSDIENLIKDKDIGWLLSSGVSLPVFKDYKLVLALQYSSGFKDVYNKPVSADQGETSRDDLQINNRTFSFVLGITLPSVNHK
jgi:opacity protein-like surface antigen